MLIDRLWVIFFVKGNPQYLTRYSSTVGTLLYVLCGAVTNVG